jgi:tight adherence protein B
VSVLLICGLFCLLGIPFAVIKKPWDKLMQPGRQRRERIRRITGKPPGKLKQMALDAGLMLQSAGMGSKAATYRWAAIIMAGIGILIGWFMDNIYAAAVLAFGLALLPVAVIRIRTSEYTRSINEKLESAMGIVTNAYIRSGDIIEAVKRNMKLIPPPLAVQFSQFLAETQFMDANIPRAISILRASISNPYFRDWCSILIQCQSDRQLRFALPGIVERFSESRRLQQEMDTTMQEHIREYLLTVTIVLGSIPLMGVMIPEWYDMLMSSLPGKIVLAALFLAVLCTALWVTGANKPLNGGGET